MKLGRDVLQINAHRLTESDFRYDVTLRRRSWRHFKQKSDATRYYTWSLCRRLCHRFLINSTFVLV